MPIFNMGPCYFIGLQPSEIQWSANGTSGWVSMPFSNFVTDNYNFYYNSTTHNWLLGVKVTSYIRFLKAPSTTGLSTVLVGGGGGGGRGDAAPSTNYKLAGGGGGAGGTVVLPNITYAANTVYKINIGAGGSGSSTGNGSNGGATSLVNNSTNITLSTASGGTGGKGAAYDSNANPIIQLVGSGVYIGGKNGTINANATNGGDGVKPFTTSYLGCGWENAYLGAGGGGGSGGQWINWNGQQFTYDTTNPGTGGGSGCGGNGGGKIGYTGHLQWNNNGYYDYWVTPNPTTDKNATAGKSSFGGGGGGGGSCALGKGTNQRNDRPGAAGGKGVFIIRSIVTV